MGYIARVPANHSEFHDQLMKLYENKGHISKVLANESSSHLEIDLDRAANMFGGEAGKDFFIPIKTGALRQAMDIVAKMRASTMAPSVTESKELYDLIDPRNK